MRTALIPHFNRQSIFQSVETLVATRLIERIMIVTMDDCDRLGPLTSFPEVQIVKSAATSFCKATLLNEGLRCISHGYVLIADADILWNRIGLETALLSVERGDLDLVWVKDVVESNPRSIGGIDHKRLAFRVLRESAELIVELFNDQGGAETRPGYGLLYSSVRALHEVGGYKATWGGCWGWEDVDLLMRAQLMGLRSSAQGSALHLTHGDEMRALRYGSRTECRDVNISRSRIDICAGNFKGDLLPCEPVVPKGAIWRDLRK